jgi:hypothetical protein
MPDRADIVAPKQTLEQLSTLSLLQARAGKAIINFRRAIDAAPLSKQARAELWLRIPVIVIGHSGRR